MTIGLSTYAFFWQLSAAAPQPLTLSDVLRRTRELGVDLLQICDYPAIEGWDDDAVLAVRREADDLGIELELGTRGIRPAHLRRYLHLAGLLRAPLVRSMVNTADDRPSADEAAAALAEVMPEFEAAGVTVALETYEQQSSTALVALVERVDSPRLGICLDPANTVAGLELPRDVVERVAPHVVNLHVKDFAFSRRDGWVGFTLAGVPLGEGLLDYDHLIDTVDARSRGLSQIIEHWLPWQGDYETTARLENEWNDRNLDYLRRNNP